MQQDTIRKFNESIEAGLPHTAIAFGLKLVAESIMAVSADTYEIGEALKTCAVELGGIK